MTPDDVYSLVVSRFAALTWMIGAATAFVCIVLAVQIGVKVFIFRRLIVSNNRLAAEVRVLLNAAALHGQITDATKERTERALGKVTSVVEAEHSKLEAIHTDVRRIDEKLPDTPSGVLPK